MGRAMKIRASVAMTIVAVATMSAWAGPPFITVATRVKVPMPAPWPALNGSKTRE